MPIAIDPTATKDYVLKRERKRPVEKQTVFKLKNLTARERSCIDDNMSQWTMDAKMIVNSNLSSIRALECGLVGWENFKDAKGNAIPFDNKPLEHVVIGVSPKIMPWDYLSKEDRQELADAIREMGQLSEAELKNSLSVQGS